VVAVTKIAIVTSWCTYLYVTNFSIEGKKSFLTLSITSSIVTGSDAPSYEIRVVSFDLDNTLWNTTATIDTANDALSLYINEQFLPSINITASNEVRVEKVMGTLFAVNKVKYSPIEGDAAKSPVLLTLLRKDAIHHVLSLYIQQNNTEPKYDSTTLETFVDEAFDVWMRARHDAISQYLTPSTMYVMEQIQSLRGKRANKKVLIGAITDGNSKPTLIPELSNVFDFYVNAEMVGIGKPDKRIYMHAVKQVLLDHTTFFEDLIIAEKEDVTDDQIEELIGPWWVHIGDDFIKDIVASNSLKMRNIWTKELLTSKQVIVPQHRQVQVTRTVDELMQVVSEKKVVEMSIGADAFLADSISNEFATAVVDKLHDVVAVLQQWQDSAQLSSTGTCENSDVNINVSSLKQDGMAVSQSQNSMNIDNRVNDVKFCTACGTKLPAIAKFCSSCGQIQ
jgi:FMN phosphatase YigB (HAD superfamily)